MALLRALDLVVGKRLESFDSIAYIGQIGPYEHRIIWELEMAQSRRDHLVDTAVALFNREGYHATGIDRILSQAGVAKMTLYKHFRSKNDLILAALRLREDRWLDWFARRVERQATTPAGRLMAVFDALDTWFQRDDFFGCMFIKAAAEYPDLDDPIHTAAAEHHRKVLAYLRELAQAAGAKRPAKLAREMMLLVEGAIAVTQVNGPVGAARQAAKIAEVLIAQEIRADA